MRRSLQVNQVFRHSESGKCTEAGVPTIDPLKPTSLSYNINTLSAQYFQVATALIHLVRLQCVTYSITVTSKGKNDAIVHNESKATD